MDGEISKVLYFMKAKSHQEITLSSPSVSFNKELTEMSKLSKFHIKYNELLALVLPESLADRNVP